MDRLDRFREDDSSEENTECPHHDLYAEAPNNVTGSLSFHELSMIIAGVCAGVTLLTMLFFKQMHATHMSNPSEQVKIMRISLLITAFSLFSFLSIVSPSAQVYLHAWLEVIEAAAMGSYFLLLCEYISPHQEQREIFIAAKRKGNVRWFTTRWILIFQFPIVSFVMALATTIAAATENYCEWSNDPGTVRFWIRLISTISLGIALITILMFYNVLKVDFAHHRPLAKMFAFKAVVFLTFVQGIVFWILMDTGVLEEDDVLTFADVNIGIPNLLICIEMVPLAIFFVTAYPWRPYLISSDNESMQGSNPGVKFTRPYQGGPMGLYAWLHMLNPSDSLRAILFAVQEVFTCGRRRRSPRNPRHTEPDTSYQMEHEPLHSDAPPPTYR